MDESSWGTKFPLEDETSLFETNAPPSQQVGAAPGARFRPETVAEGPTSASEPLLADEAALRREEAEVDRKSAHRQERFMEEKSQHESREKLRMDELSADIQKASDEVAHLNGALKPAVEVAQHRCAAVGVVFRSGHTEPKELLAHIKGMSREEAIRESQLPLGEGFDDSLLRRIRPFIIALALPTSAIGLGLMTDLLDPESLFQDPAKLALCAVMGALISGGIFATLTGAWSSAASYLIRKRHSRGVVMAGTLTAVLLFSLAGMEASALRELSTGGLSDNPAAARIPWPMAIGIALLLSGSYVMASSMTAFCAAYRKLAEQVVGGLMHDSLETARIAEAQLAKQQLAREALANHDAIHARLAEKQAELDRLRTEKQSEAERFERTRPQKPEERSPAEVARLTELSLLAAGAREYHTAYLGKSN